MMGRNDEKNFAFLTDYHLHSSFSYDSEQTIEKIARAAQEKGMSEIAVTDHVELAAENLQGGKADLAKAAAEIDRVNQQCRGLLVIRKGMELGNANLDPEGAAACCRKFTGDFIIGSVHNLEPGKDVAYYDYSRADTETIFGQYLEAVTFVAESQDYDVLGHITYPLKAICEQTGRIPDMRKYEKQFRRIFEAVIKRGKGIEVNTSGLRCRLGSLLPDRELLKWYRACGGTNITVGSDAHRPQDVGEGIAAATADLYAIGYRELTTYIYREPIRREIVETSTAGAGDKN